MEAEPGPLVHPKEGKGARLWQCFLGVTYILTPKDGLGQQASVTGEASLSVWPKCSLGLLSQPLCYGVDLTPQCLPAAGWIPLFLQSHFAAALLGRWDQAFWV